jgi:ATP/maltotriose-dependent transcriptional regulator MalT
LKTRSSRQNNSSSSPSHQTNAKWEALEPIAPLKTKLCVPPFRAGWISRLRLDKRMEAGFSRKFTLISAPAGFLKAFKGDNRYIADYFTEEVLNRQPEHLRNFLRNLSRSKCPRCC